MRWFLCFLASNTCMLGYGSALAGLAVLGTAERLGWLEIRFRHPQKGRVTYSELDG